MIAVLSQQRLALVLVASVAGIAACWLTKTSTPSTVNRRSAADVTGATVEKLRLKGRHP